MLRITLKGLQGHRVRFLLTALAVTLGVAFVAGSFVLRDSMNNTLETLLTSATKGTDVVVRGERVGAGDGSPRKPVALDLATRLAQVDGVTRVVPDIQGEALVVGRDGVVVRNGGAPTFGFAYRTDDPSFHLIAGTGPTGPDQIVLEQATMDKAGLAIGDTTRAVIGDQARTVRVVGEVAFGSLFGATAVLVDEASARSAFAGDGTVASISLTAAPGVSQEALRSRVAAVLPAGNEAVTRQTVVDETRRTVQKIFTVFSTFLLGFAFVTLFVGAFIIVNTFSIVLAQRTRELALLRAVGASRGQVRAMVLGEAAVIGLIGSVLGIAVGAGLAAVLKAVIKTFIGLDIAGGLPIGAEAVVVSVAVGVLVTALAAVLPAVRAARIPPVAAMRDDMVAPPRSIRRRGVIGIVLFAAGSALLTWAVTRTEVAWAAVALGVVLVLAGALAAAPLVTRPVVRVLTWPFQRFGGVVGRLAGQNAVRVPRRTANTASALMIGLTLVAGLAVIASSAKTSFAGVVDKQLTADYVLSAGGQSPVPGQVPAAVQNLPGVQSVAQLGYVKVTAPGIDVTANAVSGSALADTVRLDLRSGTADSLDHGQVLVNRTTAEKHGWHVGSTVTATVGTLTGQPLTVGGVFEDSQILQGIVIGRDLYTRATPAAQRFDAYVFVRAKPGTDTAALHTTLTDLVKPFLVVSVETGSEFVDSQSAQVDQLLGLLYVLLALAIVIAVLGIINTLALSVVERTREIGLLRAVGLGRRQLAEMITIESVATALFGAVLGTVLGVGLGAAFQHALAGDGLDVLSIPWGIVVTVLVASAVVGVIAAVLPAVRAVRLDILRAIATD